MSEIGGRRKISLGGEKNTQKTVPREQNEAIRDISKSYNEFKSFGRKQYTGMKVGGSRKWYYDKGEWKETKITPDKWEFNYAVTKDMLLKVLAYQSEQNTIGIFLPIKILENWMQTTIQLQ